MYLKYLENELNLRQVTQLFLKYSKVGKKLKLIKNYFLQTQ